MKCTTPLSSAPLDVAGAKPSHIIAAGQAAIRLLEMLAPVLDLGIRVLIGLVFFQSGLTKLASWSSTLVLFESEYAVPLLNPTLAAYLGTAAELCLPVLLMLGLGTRAAALALFVFNIVAVISYSGLGEVGLKDHQYWGLLLLVTMLHGPGRLSLDHLIDRFPLRGKGSH
ncbi:DoxX family protein [Cupriavidus sp. L7L]|uniref:DoxX family protein n=1 Tax=Cupriavidus sp. L7L TaxID=2546443 RepID=UPI001A9D1716|nr:DoxX family protein [Cupriavidus sp. L7L]